MLTKLREKKYFKALCITLCVLVGLGLAGVLAVAGINWYVTGSVRDRLLTEEQATDLENIDCIIVLGCQVRSDGTPSHMLEDRLKKKVLERTLY